VLYTGQGFNDSLAVIDGLTNNKTSAIYIPGLAAGSKKMASNPALGRLYVALNNIDSVAVVNTGTNSLVADGQRETIPAISPSVRSITGCSWLATAAASIRCDTSTTLIWSTRCWWGIR